MPAVEVEPPQCKVVVTRCVPKRVGSLVSRNTDRLTDAAIVLAIGIGEIRAGPAELRFDLFLRIAQLAAKLFVGEHRQMRMRDGVGTDLDPSVDVPVKFVPGHRLQTDWIVTFELGNRQRSPVSREARADENLDRHCKPIQIGEDGGCATKRVVEGRAHLPETAQGADLSQKKIRLNRETVFPRVGDGVVAENEGPASADRQLSVKSYGAQRA